MAKKINSEVFGARSTDFIYVNKDLKTKPKIYEVVIEFIIPRLHYKMCVGYTLRECIDDYYAAFNELGERIKFFRFGNEMMTDSNILQNLKLKENES